MLLIFLILRPKPNYIPLKLLLDSCQNNHKHKSRAVRRAAPNHSALSTCFETPLLKTRKPINFPKNLCKFFAINYKLYSWVGTQNIRINSFEQHSELISIITSTQAI